MYAPSLQSDFVYDARGEILDEGFITSLSNLPDVLSLKVLGMNLMLGDRPGQLLYLMSIATVSDKEPFGYHLCSNLLHAANVALLFVLLARLTKAELPALTVSETRRIQLAMAVVTLIFALHPLAVETVANVGYSSDLLVTFFTLLALLAATVFRPDNIRATLLSGGTGVVCAFAAVTSKESGIAAAGLLIVYWFLFRRGEAGKPWFWFLTAALTVMAAFLAARFMLAPINVHQASPLGKTWSQVVLIQPRLWVFMMGKIFWPVSLSADYTLDDLGGLSTPLALAILVVVLLLQAWLAKKSRLGALGVAVYWLGLATVSNFIPLYRILGDRFYYLPMVGVAIQLLALLLMTLKWSNVYWWSMGVCLVALLPLTLLTINREEVFHDEFSLWYDTVQASPLSGSAHGNLAGVLLVQGRSDEALVQSEKALEIDPGIPQVHYALGNALYLKGRSDEAMVHFQKAFELDSNYAAPHNNLGLILLRKGRIDEAIDQYEKALEINPRYAKAHNNLGSALVQKRRLDDAIIEYQKALGIDPDYAQAHTNLGEVLLQKLKIDEAIAQFQEVVRLKPDDVGAQNNLARAQAMAQPASK